jgi:D-alanyl-D-alanine carboxypeptidase/D-alanyl-D-alanine-endopeptidase (penicillin-binding protein 4)
MKKNKIVYGSESLLQKNKHFICYLIILIVITSSCSINNQIARKANSFLLKDTAISTGHIGISIYEPAVNKYWYNYNATKYFIPASNAKLFTLYAGMKYLGDSLVGLRYQTNTNNNDTSIYFEVTGDPTFLHPDFKSQPVYNFLKRNSNHLGVVSDFNFKSRALGKGWAWDDYNEDYMVERSAFPINGNLATFTIQSDTIHAFPELFSLKEYSNIITWNANKANEGMSFKIWKNRDENYFQTIYSPSTTAPKKSSIPFKTNDNKFIINLLDNILGSEMGKISFTEGGAYRFPNILHSQPTDSLFKPMMHNSDNFFAEQTLLMASNEHLGYMNDEKIIDTILNTDLIDVPQKPKWVDGSGLSRYNLFTAQSFVYILDKMKKEFGFERMKGILPTGGKGTLASYYKKDAGFIYAKTGTLSNNCAISGYLITKKGKLLIFSILANNYITGATPVRKAVEQFLQQLREKY